MQRLSRTLRARGSNGDQDLTLTYSDGEIYFTLDGEYKGNHIQIDLESLTLLELKDLRGMIDLVIKEIEK